MNYPFWEVPLLGGGMLIGVVAILHVFVSHFAVGGGLYLALTERKALRENDVSCLRFVRKHSRFFLLLTVVFGAVSGVGIWFTIGLVHPDATSTLIRTFVWGWAIEWTFFLVEICAILVYDATWERMEPRRHNLIAWIYFVSAFLSLVVINGILSFMLTPGKWLETRRFWDGFFNPSYFPSLAIRTAVTLALAGVYAMLTGSLEVEPLRSRIVRYASQWMMVSIPLLLGGVVWYLSTLPRLSLHIVSGGAPVVMVFAGLSLLFSLLIFPFAYWVGYRRPALFSTPMATLFLVFALLVTAVTEWVREAVRKPYIVYDYMYSNALLKEDLDIYAAHGFLNVAKWASVRDPSQTLVAGRELFKGQCQHCHTLDGFNSIRALVYGWSEEFTYEQLGHLDELKGFMPPFVGTDAERRVLAQWLSSLNSVGKEDANVSRRSPLSAESR